MGNCFSDPSHAKPPGKGQKLRSGPSAGASAGAGAGGGQRLGGGPGAAPATAQRYNDPPRTLGGPTSVNGSAGAGVAAGTGTGMSEEEQRDRMLRAAEERARASQSKGVSTSNPKSGQLSAKLAAERKKAVSPGGGTAANDDRMMDKGQWN